MTKLYLAGPMSGIQDFNFPAFDAAAAQLREAGYTVFNPAENDRENGFDATGMSGDPAEAYNKGFRLRTALKQDLSWICDHADGIAVLPGWQFSKGVYAERALARALGIDSMTVDEWLKLVETPAETITFETGAGFVIEEVAA
jgi:hypothetical protein